MEGGLASRQTASTTGQAALTPRCGRRPRVLTVHYMSFNESCCFSDR